MLRPVSLAFLAAALLVAPPILAEDGHDRSASTRPTTVPTETREGDRNGTDGGDHHPAAIGAFQLSAAAQSVTGSYVSFHYNDSAVTAFTVGGVDLFDAAIAGASTHRGGEDGTRAEGATVEVKTTQFELRVHDNPQAVAQFATDGRVVLTFASGVQVSVDGDTANFSVGNLSGVVRGDGLSLAGNSLSAHERMLVLTDSPRGSFDVHHDDITNAIGDARVGVEASFNKQGKDVQQDIVSFGNVTMSPIHVGPGNLTVQVEGHGFDGRVLVLNVDRGLINVSDPENLQILFDNESIGRAANLTDALDPDAHGLHAVYYVVFDPQQQAFQVIVSVPHYSVHTLSVTALELVTPSVVLGVVAGVVLLVPCAFVLFRRPKA